MDSYRRRDMTRLMLDNSLTVEDCEFLRDSVNFHEDGTCTPPCVAVKAPPPVLVVNPGDDLAYAEKVLCHVNKKIPAIKSVKERLKCDLLTAKQMVDAYTATDDFHSAKEMRYFRNY